MGSGEEEPAKFKGSRSLCVRERMLTCTYTVKVANVLFLEKGVWDSFQYIGNVYVLVCVQTRLCCMPYVCMWSVSTLGNGYETTTTDIMDVRT